MDKEIKECINSLRSLLETYSECFSCGQVIKDRSLLVPDNHNPGQYRAACPKCGKETTKSPFPPKEFLHLLEMIIENSGMKRPIIILVLSRTIFEVMIDAFLYRLLERRYTSDDIIDSVIGNTKYQEKLKIIRDLTGKNLKAASKDVGYDKLSSTLEELTRKRNAFLHDGITTKTQEVKLKDDISITERTPLCNQDEVQAINFTVDTIEFFAKAFSKNAEWIPDHLADIGV